ncbi:MAG: divalent-cation tolerance protein CutA [bacterium]
MTEALVVLVTVASRQAGEALAEVLVGEALAACVNIIGPIRSIYRWQGAVCRDDEHLLLIKTTSARYAELEARVRELHTYDNPEIIALPVAHGAAAYLEWIKGVTGNR